MVVPKAIQSSTFKELQSKFISILHPFQDVSHFKTWISGLRKEYHSANHVCWGYRIFSNHQIEENASDAGEPNGTAGLPIINALKQKEIVNGGAAVIRYFGGTKLGKRGLIDAYGKAARDVIQQSYFSPFIRLNKYRVIAPLVYYGDLSNTIIKLNGKILTDSTAEQLDLVIEIPESTLSDLIQTIRIVTKGKGDLQRI